MGKIALDIAVGLGAGDADILCEREGAYAVDYAEIHRLGSASHKRSDHHQRHVEYLGGGYGVYIVAVVEGVEHILVVSHMGEHAQLYL